MMEFFVKFTYVILPTYIFAVDAALAATNKCIYDLLLQNQN